MYSNIDTCYTQFAYFWATTSATHKTLKTETTLSYINLGLNRTVFVSVSNFHPNQIFAGKAGAYPGCKFIDSFLVIDSLS